MRAELKLQSAGTGLLDPQQCRAALCRTTRSTPGGKVGVGVGHAVPQNGDDCRGIQLSSGAIAHAQPVVATFRDVEAQAAVRAVDFAEIRHQRSVGIGHRLVPPLTELRLVGPDLHVERAGIAIGIGDLDGRIRRRCRNRAAFIDLPVAVVVDVVVAVLVHAGVDLGVVIVAVPGLRARVAIAVAILVLVDTHRLGAVVDGGAGVGAGRGVRAAADRVDASRAGVVSELVVERHRGRGAGGENESEKDAENQRKLGHWELQSGARRATVCPALMPEQVACYFRRPSDASGHICSQSFCEYMCSDANARQISFSMNVAS